MGRTQIVREPKPCDVCGKEFINRDKRVKTCSRECGKALATINHPVKATRTPRECIGCGNEFLPHRENRPQKYCTQECATAHRPTKPRTDRVTLTILSCVCVDCSIEFMNVRYPRSRCDSCNRKYNSTRTSKRITERYHSDPEFRDEVIARAHSRRVDKLGLGGSYRVVMSQLIERDESTCGICGELVTESTGPMKPSIDHIIPLSRGGLHSEENIQLAHYRCNLSKNNKLESEMAA